MVPLRRTLLVSTYTAALLGGCYNDGPYQDYIASVSAPEPITTSSTSGPQTATASITITEPTSHHGSDTDTDATSSGTQSGSDSGSDSDSSSATEGEGEVDGETKPQISLEVFPPVLTVAGHLEIVVEHTSDVARIELFQGIEEEPVLEWHAGDPPPALLVTRGKFGEHRLFRARGYDADENYVTSNDVFVELQLPNPGELLWEKTFDVGSLGEGRAIAAGMIVDEPKLLLGFHDDQSAVVGRFTAEGVPQMQAAPSSALVSITTGVALDTDEKIVAVGVELINDKEQAWVARIDPHTAAVDKLFQGKPGETATGCALDPVAKRIYVSGYGPGEDPNVPDSMLWALAEDGTLLWARRWERPVVEDFEGEPSDRALAVAVLDDGDPVIVGESYWKPENSDPETWAFAHRYSPNGALASDKSWVSEDAKYAGSAHTVIPDRDNGLLVAGWSTVNKGAPRQGTVFAFGPLLKAAEIYTSEGVDDWAIKGIARLPTDDLVYAANFDDDELGRHDVEVRGIEGLFGGPAWSHVFEADDVARVGALTLTRDAHIIVIGTRRAQGVNTMFLAALHP